MKYNRKERHPFQLIARLAAAAGTYYFPSLGLYGMIIHLKAQWRAPAPNIAGC
jgi:hypothetical protein